MDSLKGMAIFATVVDKGSMAAAAQSLGMTPSAVSQQIRKLESRAQVTLLHRTTRRLTLTEAGEAFYRSCALADRVVVMEPRPGRIRRVVEVGLAHPRERGGFDFLRQREALLHELTADGEYVAPPPRRVENLPFEFIAC